MKVGDLVQWHNEYKALGKYHTTTDYGLVLELDEAAADPANPDAKGAYIHWFSNDGNGWFDVSHPAIGVVSESR